MAYYEVKFKKEYYGLSTDVKPTIANGVTQGSTFKEVDTGDVYIFLGEQWNLQPPIKVTVIS